MINRYSLADLKQHLGTYPYKTNIWARDIGPLQLGEVALATQFKEYEAEVWGNYSFRVPDDKLHAYDHAARVAYLVLNPDNTPIELEVVAADNLVLHDGYHRWAAAIYANRRSILVDVTGFYDDLPFKPCGEEL